VEILENGPELQPIMVVYWLEECLVSITHGPTICITNKSRPEFTIAVPSSVTPLFLTSSSLTFCFSSSSFTLFFSSSPSLTLYPYRVMRNKQSHNRNAQFGDAAHDVLREISAAAQCKRAQ
jgi:hypothetical protein